MTAFPVLKLKVLPTFPADIRGGTGIEATKQNGHVVIDMAWDEFGLQSSIPTSPTSNVLTFDTATDQYVMIPSSLLGGAVAGISDAPVDGTTYARQSANWVHAPPEAPNDGLQYARQSAGWSPVAGSSFTQAGAGAITRPMQDKTREIVSITDFGAIGDGAIGNAATNATALTNALASGKEVFIPWTAAGYHFGTNTITVATSQAIVGESQVMLKSTATASLFLITSFETIKAPAVIRNLQIDMTGSGAASTAIRFRTSGGSIAGAEITQILFTNCVEAIGDEVHATNYVVDVKLFELRMLATRGRQIYIRRSRGFIWLDNVRIDQTVGSGQTVLPVIWQSASFQDFVGLEINRFDSVGPVGVAYQSTAIGLVIVGSGAGMSSVWLNRVLVDNTAGPGIYISTVNYLHANWVQAFQNLGNQIELVNVARSEISNLFVYGGVGVTGAIAGANGITVTGCSNCNIVNMTSLFNTGQGISVFNSTDNVFTNVQATNNGAWGFVESGGSAARNLLIGGMFKLNTSGDVTLSGPQSSARIYVASGTLVP